MALKTALEFTSPWCCDQHDNRFDIQQFLLRPLHTGNEPAPPKTKHKHTQNHPVKDRDAPAKCLYSWHRLAHSNDRLCAIRPPTFLLDDLSIKTLIKIHLDHIQSSANIISTLNETEEWRQEWAAKILQVILDYDAGDESSNGSSDGELFLRQRGWAFLVTTHNFTLLGVQMHSKPRKQM